MEVERNLREKYNDVTLPGSLQGQSSFFSNQGIPDSEELKQELLSLKQHSLFKPARKRFLRRTTIYAFIDHMWCLDLIDLVRQKHKSRGFAFILVCCDGFSSKCQRLMSYKYLLHVIFYFRVPMVQEA